MISFQVACEFATSEISVAGTSAFVMAQDAAQAKRIFEQVLRSSLADVRVVRWLRPLRREPCDRWPGVYVVANSILNWPQ